MTDKKVIKHKKRKTLYLLWETLWDGNYGSTKLMRIGDILKHMQKSFLRKDCLRPELWTLSSGAGNESRIEFNMEIFSDQRLSDLWEAATDI